MRRWIEQKGFPLVSFTREGGKLRVHQQRFFNDAAQKSDQTWAVSLVLRCGGPNGVVEKRFLLQKADDVIELPEGTTWVYPNGDSTGFCRCEIAKADMPPVAGLTPNERTSLLSDAWALVKSGRQHVGAFLDTSQAFRNDDDYSVNQGIGGYLASLNADLLAEADKAKFAAFVQSFYADAGGLDPTKPASSDTDAVRRASILYAKGVYGRDPKVLEQARTFIATEAAHSEAVDSNLASTMLKIAAANGDAALLQQYIDTFLARRKAGAPPALQLRYVNAMSAFEDGAARARIMQLCLDGTIPQENIGNVVSGLLTKADALEFVKANWDTLATRVGSLSVARLVQACGSLPVELAGDVAQFFAAHPIPSAEGALKKALESMKLRAEFAARERLELAAWLNRGAQAYPSRPKSTARSTTAMAAFASSR